MGKGALSADPKSAFAGPALAGALGLAQDLGPLLLEARALAAGLRLGVHGRKLAGAGDAFLEYRPLRPEEPRSRIDWRRSARADALFVREREWEVPSRLMLHGLFGPGMDWRSAPDLPTKRTRALTLLLALAIAARRGGELVGALGSGDKSAMSLETLAQTLGQGVDLRADTGGRAPARLVIAGDFYTDPDQARAALTRLVGGANSLLLIQIADPAEENLPYAGRVRIQDAAGPEGTFSRVFQRVEATRVTYQARLASHRAHWQGLARSLGGHWLVHRTNEHPGRTLALAAGILSGGRGGAA